MVLRGSIAGLAFALSALCSPPSAHADEAYVCEAGRVVYVRPGELEAMKRADACIASYYGITLAPGSQPPTPSAAAAPASRVPAAPPVAFKTLSEVENQPRTSRSVAVKLAVAEQPIARRLAPSVASPGTDFRNVRLINGTGDGWYRHNQ